MKWIKRSLIALAGSALLFGGPMMVDNIRVATLPDGHKLKAHPNDIVSVHVKDGYIEYLYRDKPMEVQQDELVERRDTNSRTYRRGNRTDIFFDAVTPYSKDANGNWFYTAKATTTEGAFNLQTRTHPETAFAQTFLVGGPGTGNQTWNVPADWNSTNNQIACVGSGGIGGFQVGGGGGGAWASTTNVSLTPGGTATYAIGASATTSTNSAAVGMVRETYFNGTASSSASLSCSYGKFPASTAGGVGGAAGLSTGATTTSGGNGGTGSAGSGGGGGGGSGGFVGPGRNGGNQNGTGSSGGGGGGSNGRSATAGANGASGGNGGNGGQGTGGTGQGLGGSPGGGDATAGTGAGGGGAAALQPGGDGSIDTSFDATHGSGGGGGGGGAGGSGGNAGTYGGGGGSRTGGANSTGGIGIIYITYVSTGASPAESESFDQIIWFSEDQ